MERERKRIGTVLLAAGIALAGLLAELIRADYEKYGKLLKLIGTKIN